MVDGGANVMSELVHRGASNLRGQMNRNSLPPDVEPRVQQGLQYVRHSTGVAASVASFLVHEGAQATMALGRHLAPHLRRHGSHLLSTALGEDPRIVSSKVDDFLEGFRVGYVSLKNATRLLAHSLANETVESVNYRYGCAVEEVTDNAVRTAGNIAIDDRLASRRGRRKAFEKTKLTEIYERMNG